MPHPDSVHIYPTEAEAKDPQSGILEGHAGYYFNDSGNIVHAVHKNGRFYEAELT